MKKILCFFLVIVTLLSTMTVFSSAKLFTDEWLFDHIKNHYDALGYTGIKNGKSFSYGFVYPQVPYSQNGKSVYELYYVDLKNQDPNKPAALKLYGKIYMADSTGFITDDFSGKPGWHINNITGYFNDLPWGQWYIEGCQYCFSAGFFAGTSDLKFSPNTMMSRAMVVNVLNRVKGSPKAARSYGFSDVKAGQWYTNAVNWAALNGIASGVGYNQFWPNSGVTREQLAVFLYKYASYCRYNMNYTSTKFNSFYDKSSVSSFAVNAMKWCNYNGIISGINENGRMYLKPKKGATRAEVASMIMKFCKKFDNRIMDFL